MIRYPVYTFIALLVLFVGGILSPLPLGLALGLGIPLFYCLMAMTIGLSATYYYRRHKALYPRYSEEGHWSSSQEMNFCWKWTPISVLWPVGIIIGTVWYAFDKAAAVGTTKGNAEREHLAAVERRNKELEKQIKEAQRLGLEQMQKEGLLK